MTSAAEGSEAPDPPADEPADDPVDTAVDAARPSLGSRFRRLFAATLVSNLGDGMAIVAYPWLASAVTRNPALIALVAVAQRLPWLVFSLPAGVIIDRVDRRRVMVSMDVARGVLTLGVAIAVLGEQGTLPGPNEVDAATGTHTWLYAALLVATVLLGMAEVLRDNAAQTFLPNIVHADQLEKANGRMWGAEAVMNTFVGPPLGSVLLLAAFSIPFFVHSGTFFAAAAIVMLIPGTFRAGGVLEARRSFRDELGEGVRWLWDHSLLRTLAIILGLSNLASTMAVATIVLFAQEVVGVGPLLFSVIFFGGAIGAFVGGQLAHKITHRLGRGTALAVALAAMAVIPVLIGLLAWWPVMLVLFAVQSVAIIVWNVITVSLRQTIIPEHLLGRVNSVYRFFGWGMMPIGAGLGGLIVLVVERVSDRDLALRSTWFASGLIGAALFEIGRRQLSTERIEAAREAATAPPAA
jgi:MFS family permease